MTSPASLDGTTLDRFSDQLRGASLQPGDDSYDEARTVWNGRFDKYPGLIIQPSGAADVVTAVNFAREHDLPVSVKSGGHDYAGNGVRDDGLMIDLSEMDAIRVNPEAKTARVGPGATWGDVDHETQAFGLATTGATVSTVGVAGYTLGGGTGFLARMHGISADNLRSADVVTADGNFVRASESEHPELFWALRGGAGNFGIVTSLQFDLYEVGPRVLAGQILHPFEEAPEVLRFYRSYMAEAPDEVMCGAFIVPIPPEPPFPEELHGETALDLVAFYSGSVEDGREALAPIREFGDPILDGVRPQPYTELQKTFDDGAPKGQRYYSKAQYIDELTDDAIDTFVERIQPLRGPLTMAYFEPMGGAINRVDSTATAFPHRDAAYSVHVLTGWTDPAKDEELIGWTNAFHDAMGQYSSGDVYVNLLDRDEAERVTAAYGTNYDRLAELKREWDPRNLFSTNQNIEPTD